MFSNASDQTDAGAEASVYQQVLGAAFETLDPQLRRYFGPIPASFAGMGTGRFEEAGLRLRVLRPVFAALSRLCIAFPDLAFEVPFSVRNEAGVDGSLLATRTFEFPHVTRVMKDSMRVTDGKLFDRIGTRGQIEAELAIAVSAGQLQMRSRRLWLRVLGLRLPLPPLVVVHLEERTLSHAERTQRVDLRVTAALIGEIYGYRGTFTYEFAAI